MANQEMVKVDLKNSVGLRGPDGVSRLYGPGKGIEVPRKLADGLGLSTNVLAAKRREAAGGDEGGANFDEMKVADLEEYLRSEQVDVARLKGTGGQSKDQVVKADLVKAAKAKAAGNDPEYLPQETGDQGTGDDDTGDTGEGDTDATTEDQGGQE